jgi:hypothetical protein
MPGLWPLQPDLLSARGLTSDRTLDARNQRPASRLDYHELTPRSERHHQEQRVTTLKNRLSSYA